MKNIPQTVKTGENISVSVDVTNTGNMDGDEVVQSYVSLPDSKLRIPIRALQGFKRVHLKKGETQTVEFTLKPHQFAARNNVAVVEAGKVLVAIGGKQPDASSVVMGKAIQETVDVSGNIFYINE